MQKLFISAASLLLFSNVFISCADPKKEENETTPAGIDRKEILTHIADDIVIPAYAKYQEKLDLLAASADSFVGSPGQSRLIDLRLAWQNAYIEWQKVELFDFAKAENIGLRFYTNLYPVSEAKVKANVQNPSANLALPSNYDAQGYPALDFMINGLANNDTEILNQYTTDANADKNKAYLLRLISNHKDLINTVRNDWAGTGHEEFISSIGTSIGSSFSEMTNAYVKNYERYIRSGKIGIPSGAMMDGTPIPTKVEAFYKKDLSKVLAQTAHQASLDFFEGKGTLTGTPGKGFKSYLDAINAVDATSGQKLSNIIADQFGVVNTKFSGLNDNFYDQLQTDVQPYKDIFLEMQKMVKYMKVDMTSAMTITITYTDNDGD